MSRPLVMAVPLVFLYGCIVPRSVGGDAAAGTDRQGPSSGNGESCGNGIDDNGNGKVDEGCPCAAGATQRCYGGPLSTRGAGACHDGTQTCVVASGASMGTWGECTGD